MFSRLTMNLAGAQKRYETFDGKQYLVLPAVALTEGVHAGSKGPLYYPPEEIARNPQTWNHKPVVLYHPSLPNGEGITACDPGVFERQGVGLIFNSNSDGRLKMEVWLDETKLRRMDSRVTDAIEAGKMVEVSTGLYHDIEEKEGTWNGESYSGIVRNMQPDHLAILPDQKGSCSIADGAGLLRNSTGEVSYDDIRTQLMSLCRPAKNLGSGPLTECGGDNYCYVCDIYPKYAIVESSDKTFKVGYKLKAGKVILDGEPEEVRKVTSYVTANSGVSLVPTVNEDHQGPVRSGLPPPSEEQLSDVMKHQQMQKALGEHYSGVAQEGDWGGWTTDIYANYVVYLKDGKRFRLPYTYDDDMIRFDGEPEEVMRSSEYVTRRTTPIDGTQSPYNVNQEPIMPTPAKPAATPVLPVTTNTISDPKTAMGGKGDSQTRTERVGAMINSGHAKETDRQYLMDLPDDGFASVEAWVKKGATQPTVPYSYEGIGDRSNVHNTQGKPVTVNQYVEQAPPEIREMLVEGMQTFNAEKQRLVEVVKGNPNNRFNPEWLMTQNMQTLRGLAALAGGQRPQAPRSPNYGGQGDIPMFLDTPQQTQNVSTDDDDILPIPTMNFDRVQQAQ